MSYAEWMDLLTELTPDMTETEREERFNDPSVLPGQLPLDFGQHTIQNNENTTKTDNIVSEGEKR